MQIPQKAFGMVLLGAGIVFGGISAQGAVHNPKGQGLAPELIGAGMGGVMVAEGLWIIGGKGSGVVAASIGAVSLAAFGVGVFRDS